MTEEYSVQNYHRMSILLNSRTVLEKKDYVSTGILTYAEGDMIEIEIGDYKLFELKDKVKVTVYTPEGIFMFTTMVIAKDQGTLMVINPPENRRKFTEKRVYTRLEIESPGKLEAIRSFERAQVQILPEPINITLRNISINGVGFVMDRELRLESGMHVFFTAHIGIKLSCSAVIMQARKDNDNEMMNYYGAEFFDVPDAQLQALRAFLLTKQVELHSKSKDEVPKKRIFK